MILLKITNIKLFMQHLLLNTTFDKFYIGEMKIMTACNFFLEGRINKDFYDTEELEQLNTKEYVTWSEIRKITCEIVKGNKKPILFNIDLIISQDNLNNIFYLKDEVFNWNDINSCHLNIKYKNNELTIVTGISFKIFTMNKNQEYILDKHLKNFLNYYNIEFIEL